MADGAGRGAPWGCGGGGRCLSLQMKECRTVGAMMPSVAAAAGAPEPGPAGPAHRLLATLPAAVTGLRPHLRGVDLPAGHRLIEPGDRVRQALWDGKASRVS
jgi:hypothetical protein